MMDQEEGARDQKDEEESEDPILKLKKDEGLKEGQAKAAAGDFDVDAELLRLKKDAWKYYKSPIEGTDYTFYCNPMEREDVSVQFGKIR